MHTKKIFYIFLLFLILLTLTSCGNLKNAAQMISYIEKQYNIEAEVIATEESEEKVIYTMKDKDRNIIFTAHTYFADFRIDGSTFFSYETTYNDYYYQLTSQLKNNIKEIEEKYNIKFMQNPGFERLINRIIFPTGDINFEITEAAVNELNKLYNFPIELSSENKQVFICVKNEKDADKPKYTEYYYNYTLNSSSVTLHNSNSEFYEQYEIPERLDEDIINFVNTKHSVNCEIDNLQILPYYDYDSNRNYYNRILGITLLDRNAKFKIEYRIDLKKYRTDVENDTFSAMEDYIDDYIEYVYN